MCAWVPNCVASFNKNVHFNNGKRKKTHFIITKFLKIFGDKTAIVQCLLYNKPTWNRIRNIWVLYLMLLCIEH